MKEGIDERTDEHHHSSTGTKHVETIEYTVFKINYEQDKVEEHTFDLGEDGKNVNEEVKNERRIIYMGKGFR